MANKRVPGGNSEKTVPFEGFFTSMLNAITESAFLMTPEGVVLAANRAVAMRLGFKKGDDLQGRNIFELHSPEVAEFRRKQVSRVVATGEPIQFEDLRSGRHILNSIYPVSDQSGSVSRLAVFGMDITDRKMAEEAQRESEERFKALHNASFGGIAIHDTGLILDCNRGLSEITGYSHEELIGMDGLLLIAEKSREMVMNNILCGYEKPYEVFGLRKNGDEYPVQLRAKTIPHRGKSVRVVEFRDITERRKAEDLLRESERKYRTLAENMKDVIWTMDPENMMFTYVSPSVTRLRGYTPGEIMAEPMDKAFTDENRKAMRDMVKKGREDFLAGRISSDSFFTEEIEQPCKDGSTVWTEAITRFLLNPDTGRVEIHGVTRDVSERRKAEQEYQTLFREMLDGFALHEIICDEDGKPSDYRFLAVNPAFERMTGFKAKEMLGKTVLTVMPGTEPSWIEAYGKVALTGEPAFFENFSSEVGKHFLVSAFSPEPNKFACIFSDITDLKRSEEELAANYLLLSMAGRTARFGGWVVDLTSNVSTWSDAVADIHEMPRGFSPLVEEGISFYHPDWQQRISEVFADCALKGIPYDEEMEVVTGSGKRVWVRTSGEAVRDGSGKIIKVQGSFQDISQSKKAEAAIRESEHRFRTLANSGRAMIWTSGLDKKCDYFNQPWLDFTGRSLEQEIGDGWVEGVHPDDLQFCVNTYTKAFDTRKSFSMVYRLRRNDGEFRWILDDGMPRYGTEGVFLGFIGHCLDITERKVAEDALKETLGRLRRLTGSVIQVIVMAVESRDPYTAGHQRRVGDLARSIASEMGIPLQDSEGIRVAGIIHDLGKISIPSEILSKPRKLNDTEFALVKEHPQRGYDILKSVDFDWPVAEMILQHHERLNGSGYPRGLKGEEITQGAKIIAVADVVEAMASHRPYRPTLGLDAALEEISLNRGTLFDTDVVEACLRLFREKGYRLLEG